MKKWYKSEKSAQKDAEKEGCRVVCGSNGYTDIYYLVPKNAERGKIYKTISRAQSDCQGREYMYRVIYITKSGDVEVIESASKYRINRVKRGDIPNEKVTDYLNGYYTLAEERSEKIKQRKENARLSHAMCDATGKAGHDERQRIRRELNRK